MAVQSALWSPAFQMLNVAQLALGGSHAAAAMWVFL